MDILWLPERNMQVIGPNLPPLAEQLRQGESFDATLTVQSRTNPFDQGPGLEMAESDVIKDYFAFLRWVMAVAQFDHDTESGAKMLAMADRFAYETTYLSVAGRKQALRGLMDEHVTFLRDNPEAQVSLFVPVASQQESVGLLAGEAKQLVRIYAPDVARRVQVSSTLLVAEAPTKTVFLHDWSANGARLSGAIADALYDAGGPSAPGDIKASLEVNLLILRQDQLEDRFEALFRTEERYCFLQPVPVVAYLRTPVGRRYEGPMPCAAHSSPELGFEVLLFDMRQYIFRQTGKSVRLPYLASVAHPH
jgi:hypothetical protein